MKTKTLILFTLIVILITGGVLNERIRQETDRGNQEVHEENIKIFQDKPKSKNISNNYADIDMDIDNNRLTADEYKLLIKIVYLEARGETKEGKAAVVRTIINRVKSEDFPDSIEKVIFQPGQFQPAKHIEKLEVEEIYIAEIEEAIQIGLGSSGKEMYFVNPLLANKNSYNWMTNNLTFIKRIGNHEFYK